MNNNYAETPPQVGPYSVSFLQLILRSLAGLGGGILGMLVLLLIFVLGSSVLKPVLTADSATDTHPLFVFVFMIMIFLTMTAANVLAPLLISFTDRDKYKKVGNALYQIFILNVIVFIFSAPIYLIGASVDLSFVAYTAGMHIMVSALGSALILEVLADNNYALIGIYSVVFGLIMGTGLNFIIYQATGKTSVLLFVAVPLIWGAIGFFEGLVGMIYRFVYESYGTDFLNSSINVVESAEEDLTEDLIKEEDSEDVDGKDFF